MASALIQLLAFLIFFLVLPMIYIIVFIKIIAWVLNLESTIQKIAAILFMLLMLPILIYVHMVAIYVVGGGH